LLTLADIARYKFVYKAEGGNYFSAVPQLRQKLLVLYSQSPDLNSPVGAWAIYDGTGKEQHTTGDSDKPPYTSVVGAMQDGWRVIQFPQQFPAYPGMEYNTAFLKFEYILEKLEEIP
jgi:hypothetical protein